MKTFFRFLLEQFDICFVKKSKYGLLILFMMSFQLFALLTSVGPTDKCWSYL